MKPLDSTHGAGSAASDQTSSSASERGLLTRLLGFFSLSYISAGFVAVLVGYTSSAVIIFQAAEATGASSSQISSWLWALGIGMGITSAGLSLWFKTPVLTAWSTPGAALLVTSLPGFTLQEAIGIFLFSSGLILICGLTGIFDRLMKQVPQALAAAMLAGVLLQFGINAFKTLEHSLLIAGLMLAAFLLLRHLLPRYVIPLVLVTGVLTALFQGQLAFDAIPLQLAEPEWVLPSFSLQGLIGVGIPLFVVTMASQNLPGVAVLRANGYQTPVSPLLSVTGLTGLVLAPFGGFSFNLAAITAAICMGKEAGPEPEKRYQAAVWAGLFYLLTGLFAASVTAVFAAFPQALILTIAGLALLGTIGNSLASALTEPQGRDAALLTFLVTASGVSLFGIGSAFWGLVLGLIAWHLQGRFART